MFSWKTPISGILRQSQISTSQPTNSSVSSDRWLTFYTSVHFDSSLWVWFHSTVLRTKHFILTYSTFYAYAQAHDNPFFCLTKNSDQNCVSELVMESQDIDIYRNWMELYGLDSRPLCLPCAIWVSVDFSDFPRSGATTLSIKVPEEQWHPGGPHHYWWQLVQYQGPNHGL